MGTQCFFSKTMGPFSKFVKELGFQYEEEALTVINRINFVSQGYFGFLKQPTTKLVGISGKKYGSFLEP